MGLVKKEEAAAEAAKEEEPEIIKKLKAKEDEYMKLEEEFEKELQKLVLEYTAKQKPILDERCKLISQPQENGPKTGTPSCTGFWLKALKNHPSVQDLIREWDEPVLQYLQDIQYTYVDPEDSNKGFKLSLTFAENPYFTNTTLEKEYKTEMENAYCGQTKVLGITCTEVEWKDGQNVTVDKASKPKGGKKPKGKAKAPKEEARPSFFRDFFRDLEPGMTLPQDAKEMAMAMHEEEESDEDEEDDEDDENEEKLVAQLMDFDFEAGSAFKDDLVPRGVRWYTGEAAPEDEDDDEDEEEEDDDDEDEEESDDEPAPKAKAKGKKGKASPELKAKEAPKEECKQQ